MFRYGLIVTVAVWLAAFAVASLAKVYYSKQEAMELAFGKGAEVVMLSLFLNPAQRKAVERLGRVRLDSDLYTFYVGKRDGKIVGYAAIESHTVRTKPETLLIVLTPDGRLRKVVVLAFHEPPEYQPPDVWLTRLVGVAIDGLRLGGEVEGITGATLSARAALDSVRKVLALFRVMIAERR